MTPKEFIEKWKDNPLGERASYQIHCNDLCELVGVPKCLYARRWKRPDL